MLSLNQWWEIPITDRMQFIQEGRVSRSSFVDVRGNQIVSDGVTEQDLKTISEEDLKFINNKYFYKSELNAQNNEQAEEDTKVKTTNSTGDTTDTKSSGTKKRSKRGDISVPPTE